LNSIIEAVNAARRKSAATNSSSKDVTNRSLRIGVPERATDGQQDASPAGAIYMAAKKKTAKKSTKKKSSKKKK
jgi:hypothetical protein